MPILTDILMLAGAGGATKNVEYIAAGSNYGLHIFKFDPNTNSLTQTATYNLFDQSIAEIAPSSGAWASNNKIFFMATHQGSATGNTRITTFRMNEGSLSYYATHVEANSCGLYGGSAGYRDGSTRNVLAWSRGAGETGNASNTLWNTSIGNTTPTITTPIANVTVTFPKLLDYTTYTQSGAWTNTSYFMIGTNFVTYPTSNNFGSIEDAADAHARRAHDADLTDYIAISYTFGVYVARWPWGSNISRINNFTLDIDPLYRDISMEANSRFFAVANSNVNGTGYHGVDILGYITSNGTIYRVQSVLIPSPVIDYMRPIALKFNNYYNNTGDTRLYVSATQTYSGNNYSNLTVISCNATGHATILATYNLRDVAAGRTYNITKIYDVIPYDPYY